MNGLEGYMLLMLVSSMLKVNFACFMEKGKSLIDDDEDLNMNENHSCVVRRIVGAIAKE